MKIPTIQVRGFLSDKHSLHLHLCVHPEMGVYVLELTLGVSSQTYTYYLAVTVQNIICMTIQTVALYSA